MDADSVKTEARLVGEGRALDREACDARFWCKSCEGRSARECRGLFGLEKLSVEFVRVCMNGIVLGGVRRGSSTFESRLAPIGPVNDVPVVEVLMCFSEMEEFFFLCLEVRFDSNGFISGGSMSIWRKITAR